MLVDTLKHGVAGYHKPRYNLTTDAGSSALLANHFSREVMTMSIKHIAAAAALVCGAQAALAADLNVTHNLSGGAFFMFVGKSAGAFTDTYTFNLNTLSTASFTIDELVLTGFTNIDWADTDAATLSGGGLLSPLVLGEDGLDSSFSFNNVLVTGSVTLVLKGVALGSGIPDVISPGTYSIAAVAAPIPEPETYALMLGGLGLIGFMAARRRRQD